MTLRAIFFDFFFLVKMLVLRILIKLKIYTRRNISPRNVSIWIWCWIKIKILSKSNLN